VRYEWLVRNRHTCAAPVNRKQRAPSSIDSLSSGERKTEPVTATWLGFARGTAVVRSERAAHEVVRACLAGLTCAQVGMELDAGERAVQRECAGAIGAVCRLKRGA
jgi:hypothetical protein